MYKISTLEIYSDLVFDIATIKQYSRISHNDEDDLIVKIFQSVQDYAETIISSPITRRSYKLSIANVANIDIPIKPILEIIKIEANGKDITTQASVNLANYNIILDKTYADILVIFKVGFESQNSLPADLKLAMLDHFMFLYDNRGDENASIPNRVTSIYKKYKTPRFTVC